MPQSSVKGQVLADLKAKFVEPQMEIVAEERNMDEKSVGTISMQGPSRWKVYVDGAANHRGSGVGLVLISPEEIIIEKSSRLRVLSHKQWSQIWDLTARNDHGTENGGKGNGNVLGLEIGCGPSKGGARGQRCENAGVFESGQALTIGFWILWRVTRL